MGNNAVASGMQGLDEFRDSQSESRVQSSMKNGPVQLP